MSLRYYKRQGTYWINAPGLDSASFLARHLSGTALNFNGVLLATLNETASRNLVFTTTNGQREGNIVNFQGLGDVTIRPASFPIVGSLGLEFPIVGDRATLLLNTTYSVVKLIFTSNKLFIEHNGKYKTWEFNRTTARVTVQDGLLFANSMFITAICSKHITDFELTYNGSGSISLFLYAYEPAGRYRKVVKKNVDELGISMADNVELAAQFIPFKSAGRRFVTLTHPSFFGSRLIKARVTNPLAENMHMVKVNQTASGFAFELPEIRPIRLAVRFKEQVSCDTFSNVLCNNIEVYDSGDFTQIFVDGSLFFSADSLKQLAFHSDLHWTKVIDEFKLSFGEQSTNDGYVNVWRMRGPMALHVWLEPELQELEIEVGTVLRAHYTSDGWVMSLAGHVIQTTKLQGRLTVILTDGLGVVEFDGQSVGSFNVDLAGLLDCSIRASIEPDFAVFPYPYEFGGAHLPVLADVVISDQPDVGYLLIDEGFAGVDRPIICDMGVESSIADALISMHEVQQTFTRATSSKTSFANEVDVFFRRLYTIKSVLLNKNRVLGSTFQPLSSPGAIQLDSLNEIESIAQRIHEITGEMANSQMQAATFTTRLMQKQTPKTGQLLDSVGPGLAQYGTALEPMYRGQTNALSAFINLTTVTLSRVMYELLFTGMFRPQILPIIDSTHTDFRSFSSIVDLAIHISKTYSTQQLIAAKFAERANNHIELTSLVRPRVSSLIDPTLPGIRKQSKYIDIKQMKGAGTEEDPFEVNDVFELILAITARGRVWVKLMSDLEIYPEFLARVYMYYPPVELHLDGQNHKVRVILSGGLENMKVMPDLINSEIANTEFEFDGSFDRPTYFAFEVWNTEFADVKFQGYNNTLFGILHNSTFKNCKFVADSKYIVAEVGTGGLNFENCLFTSSQPAKLFNLYAPSIDSTLRILNCNFNYNYTNSKFFERIV